MSVERGVKEWVPGGFVPWLMPWMKTARSPQYYAHGLRHKIVANYGLNQIGEQAPYFSMTGTVFELHRSTWAHMSSGAIADHIEQHFKKLAPFAKWHLTSTEGPMYYVANGVYWWEIATGRREQSEMERGRVDPLSAFRHTIVFGAVEGDEMPPMDAPPEAVAEWLRERRPALRRAFREAMREAYELDT